MWKSVKRHPSVIQELPLPVLLQVDFVLVPVEMEQVPETKVNQVKLPLHTRTCMNR